jgi:hypothetical protein
VRRGIDDRGWMDQGLEIPSGAHNLSASSHALIDAGLA